MVRIGGQRRRQERLEDEKKERKCKRRNGAVFQAKKATLALDIGVVVQVEWGDRSKEKKDLEEEGSRSM